MKLNVSPQEPDSSALIGEEEVIPLSYYHGNNDGREYDGDTPTSRTWSRVAGASTGADQSWLLNAAEGRSYRAVLKEVTAHPGLSIHRDGMKKLWSLVLWALLCCSTTRAEIFTSISGFDLWCIEAQRLFLKDPVS
ncbi:hypothetical protein EYF80_045989 [Liparis tanakae]|uniref:Uncharacterized protein n=1 Tax=Liparis tanakae TaxID=230148 RepID=A0A4Z2FST8_9TELE|nr:hypothetical protein EYF80_045989 [Liparis tanakae]